MLLSLHIVKVEPGHYRTHMMDGHDELGNWDTSSVREAIAQAGADAHPELLGYHLWYAHVCAGTVAPADMAAEPEAIAQRLMELYARFSP